MSNSDSTFSSRGVHRAALLWIALILLALVNLMPLAQMIALAFEKSATVSGAENEVWGGAWARLVKSAPLFPRWTFNSAAISILSVAFHLVADSMAAFVLAKRNFRGRAVVFALILLAMMVPRQVTLIPLFLRMSSWGLADSFAGLLLPGLGDVIGIFLLRQHILTLPDSLLEAARMDGASQWAIYREIILPLSKPALAVMGVLAFQRYWSDFFWPLVIAHDEKNYTLQSGLSYLSQSEFGPDYPLMAAGACAAAIPALLVFFIFRRAFFEGFRGGAIK